MYNFVEGGGENERSRLLAVPDYFGVYDAMGGLIGFRCFGTEARVPGYRYDDGALDTGGGLRPDLTGKGHGFDVVQAGLRFGRARFRPAAFRATVAVPNERAKRVLRRIGFDGRARFLHLNTRMPFDVLVWDGCGGTDG